MFETFKALFLEQFGDSAVEVKAINGQMTIMAHDGPIIIAKEQCMKFYGLEERPATKCNDCKRECWKEGVFGCGMFIDVKSQENKNG